MNISEKRESDERLPREFFTRDGLTVARELLGKILVHETSVGTIRGVITEVESYMGVNDKGSHTYGGRRTERTEPMFRQGGNSYVYFTYGMYHCMNITSGSEGDPQAVLIRSVVPANEESKQRMVRLRMEIARRQAEKKTAGREQATGKEQAASGDLAIGKEQARKDSTERNLTERFSGDRGQAEKALAESVLMEKKLQKRQSAILKNLADGPGKMCIAMEISRADNAIDMIESQTFYVTEGIDIRPEEIQTGKRIGIDYAEEAAEYLWRFYIV